MLYCRSKRTHKYFLRGHVQTVVFSLGHNTASQGKPCYFRNSALTLFVCFDSLRPINNLSVKQGRVFQGCTSTKLG